MELWHEQGAVLQCGEGKLMFLGKTVLTGGLISGYCVPVAGKIQQYGFGSLFQRWVITAIDLFSGGFLFVYHAPVGRDSQEAFGLAVSFERSSNLIIPPFLRLEAQPGLTPIKGALS